MPPVIHVDKCKLCGNCTQICPEDVFCGSRPKEVPVVAYPEECAHCSACVEECPVEGAISLRVPLPMMVLYRPEWDLPL
jgi:adenylylsulfate reductase, subunit B